MSRCSPTLLDYSIVLYFLKAFVKLKWWIQLKMSKKNQGTFFIIVYKNVAQFLNLFIYCLSSVIQLKNIFWNSLIRWIDSSDKSLKFIECGITSDLFNSCLHHEIWNEFIIVLCYLPHYCLDTVFHRNWRCFRFLFFSEVRT